MEFAGCLRLQHSSDNIYIHFHSIISVMPAIDISNRLLIFVFNKFSVCNKNKVTSHSALSIGIYENNLNFPRIVLSLLISIFIYFNKYRRN